MAQTSAQSTVNKIEMRLKGKGRGSIVFQLLWCTHERPKIKKCIEAIDAVIKSLINNQQ